MIFSLNIHFLSKTTLHVCLKLGRDKASVVVTVIFLTAAETCTLYDITAAETTDGGAFLETFVVCQLSPTNLCMLSLTNDTDPHRASQRTGFTGMTDT